MNKNNIHFKIAAWSIKYPTYFYGACLFVMITIGLSIFLLYRNTTSTPLLIPSSLTPFSTKIADPDWEVLSENMYGDKKCISLRNKENGTVINSCYVLSDGQWVFDQSY